MTYNDWYVFKADRAKSYIFDIHVKTGFGIKQPTMVDMSYNKPNQILYI